MSEERQRKKQTLVGYALEALQTENARDKAHITRELAVKWRSDQNHEVGHVIDMLDRPARPDAPELLPPNMMPKRAKAGSKRAKIALLHALAHIELNAIDLAWDILARFSGYSDQNVNDGFSLPRAFFDDWVKVADDEAKHFLMLDDRLCDLGASYGVLPAHDGLWEASLATKDDFAARLAIVPMVLEARGLDVTPGMIERMNAQEDFKTAQIFQIIHDDEITHVKAGTDWFKSWCDHHDLDVETHWQTLVRTYFKGRLKPPFNHPSRFEAGMIRDWYEPLAEEAY